MEILLEENDFSIRKYQKEDLLNRFNAIQKSIEEVSKWLSFCRPDYTEEQNMMWFLQYEKNWNLKIELPFLIENKITKEFLGEITLNHFNDLHMVANIVYWVKTGCTGKSIATRATKLIAKYAFDELGLNRVELFMEPENIASIKSAEKAGAKKEGLLRNRIFSYGKSKNALMYSIIPEDFI